MSLEKALNHDLISQLGDLFFFLDLCWFITQLLGASVKHSLRKHCTPNKLH